MFLRSALSPSRDEGHLRGGDETAYENRSEFIIQRGDNQAGGHGRLTRDSRADLFSTYVGKEKKG